MRKLCFILVCLLLTACTAGTGSQSARKQLSQAEQVLNLRAGLAQIPGAEVAAGAPLLVSFPLGTLFAQGSALPIASGIAPLDALVALVKQSEAHWQVRLRAASGEGAEYDAQLATMRARIIKTYFKNSGINLLALEITAVAETGAPLELKLVQ